MTLKHKSLRWIGLASAIALLVASIAMLGLATGLKPIQVISQLMRIGVTWTAAVLYAEDMSLHHARSEQSPFSRKSPTLVLEHPDAPHLKALRERYKLDQIIASATDEYEAQIRLAQWAGSRFDHGTDEVPGGRQVCQSVAVIEAGEAGSRFWCEIAAYTMIHAATAMGWPARMITLSTDGYTWEHAVAELWSTQFEKWFVIDTDFNVVYEVDGRPLSAWELVHQGRQLRRDGRLNIRRFERFKKGLAEQDLLVMYRYAHADFRTDWCTRPLRRGSPAGGDLNTRRISAPTLGRLLTAIPTAERREDFEPSPPFYRANRH